MKKINEKNILEELNFTPSFDFLSVQGKKLDVVFGKIYLYSIQNHDGVCNVSAPKLGKELGIARWTIYRILEELLSMKIIVALGGDVWGFKIDYDKVTELSIQHRKINKNKKNLSSLIEN